MAWRMAKSLEVLRGQVNSRYPGRSTAADGGIGDEAHASRSSDHNPWVQDGKMGVVTARDFTNDPAHGVSSEALASAILKAQDPRLKYVISNRKIGSGPKGPQPGVWRKYTGANPHDHHFHISVNDSKALYDSEKPWDLSGVGQAVADPGPQPSSQPFLKRGAKGAAVKQLQVLLGITADGDFGPKTEAKVKEFQKSKGLVADGKVGTYTWAQLEKGAKK